uniref:Transmembrane protein 273 n=1 Tax=Equus asinus TaxID=9793 RepID=A0A9L0ID01_EQUAS
MEDAGGAQVLATGKSAGAETDIKYALIGTALGVAISAGFLVLKICLIKKHLWDNESTDQRNTNPDPNDTTVRKKRGPRYGRSQEGAGVILPPVLSILLLDLLSQSFSPLQNAS